MIVGIPQIRVSLYGEWAEYKFQASLTPEGNYKPLDADATGDLLDVRTTKRMNPQTPAGEFQIALVAQRDAKNRRWDERIRPMDLVVIEMRRFTGSTTDQFDGWHTVMVGFVDTVHFTRSFTAGPKSRPQQAVMVRGRDGGMIFTRFVLNYWTFFGALTPVLRVLASTGSGAQPSTEGILPPDALQGTPAEIAHTYITKIMFNTVGVATRYQGRAVTWSNMLRFRASSLDVIIPFNVQLAATGDAAGGMPNWWQQMVRLANPPWHEIYVDTRRTGDVVGMNPSTTATVPKTSNPGIFFGQDLSNPTLIMRPTPWPHMIPTSLNDLILAHQGISAGDLGLSFPDGRAQARFTAGQRLSGADYTPGGWDDLVKHTVNNDDKVEIGTHPFQREDMRSGMSQPNAYYVTQDFVYTERQSLFQIIELLVNIRQMFRYAYNPLLVPTLYFQTLRTQDGDFSELDGATVDTPSLLDFLARLQYKVASFQNLLEVMRTTTMAVHLRPEIHIGERLLDKSADYPLASGARGEGMLYYVTGVNHQFTPFVGANTTLQLERGLPEFIPSNEDQALGADVTPEMIFGYNNLGNSLPGSDSDNSRLAGMARLFWGLVSVDTQEADKLLNGLAEFNQADILGTAP